MCSKMPSPFKLQTRDADRFTNPGGHNQPILIGIEVIENPNSANGKGVINGKAGKAVHNDAFFQNFYGATWIGKRSPFFYHFGIAYSPL